MRQDKAVFLCHLYFGVEIFLILRVSSQKVTGEIHQKIETMAAARAIQSGSKIKLRDVKVAGKEMAKDLRKETLTKKKSKKDAVVSSLKRQLELDDRIE